MVGAGAGIRADHSVRRTPVAHRSARQGARDHVHLRDLQGHLPDPDCEDGHIQQRLGADFGPRVRFVSVTVEPEVDTPAVLKAYAERFGADPAGWSFLTGSGTEVNDVVRRYGAFAKRVKPGEVDHLFLTSLVDRRGMLRVQYLGYRFDPDEMLRDLRSLLRE